MYLSALVIDDEPHVRRFVGDVLSNDGWQVSQAESAERACEMLFDDDWSIVFCDVRMSGADGLSVLKKFKEELPQTKVVLMTGHGNAADALEATSVGAYDYLLKPFSLEALQSLSRAVADRLAHSPRQRLLGANPRYQCDVELVGRSSAFIEVMKQVGRVAPTNLPVLLTGESGTGKEVVASALHSRSARRELPFVVVNCGAIPADLIESELFGHVKGSFTGADRDRRGLWEEAHGGTVFLDEITETSLTFQVKLLRALQEGEIRRVGSNQTFGVDVRVIAASNRDIESEVRAGRFRQDLFYRLNVVSIVLPPLRERREDILQLATRFVENVFPTNNEVRFSPAALELMERYPWPGNIRELENAVVRAATMSDGTIRSHDLPERVRAVVATKDESDVTKIVTEAEWISLAAVEARYVTRVLEHTHGNKQAAARVLAVDRKTLDRMIKRHDIKISSAICQRHIGPAPRHFDQA